MDALDREVFHEDRSTGELQIVLYATRRKSVVKFAGSAQNSDEEVVQRALDDATNYATVHGLDVVLIDLFELKFCFSSIVRVLLGWMTDAYSRPAAELVMNVKIMWQATSLRAMVSMAPRLTVVEQEAAQVLVCTCEHLNHTTEDKNFFAPTGNGCIVTITSCVDCGLELDKSTEYFN